MFIFIVLVEQVEFRKTKLRRFLFCLGRAGYLGKSISFFDPERDSDRRIAPDLILKLSEV